MPSLIDGTFFVLRFVSFDEFCTMFDVCYTNHNNKKLTAMENKLQRNMKNRVIGGVCSGLADYFGIDAAIVRVIFAFALLAFSTGFWIYIILWMVMPAGNGTETMEGASGIMNAESSGKPKGGMTAGLILIGIGALGLLHQYIPQISWRTAWPVLLIILGIFLIVPFNAKKS